MNPASLSKHCSLIYAWPFHCYNQWYEKEKRIILVFAKSFPNMLEENKLFILCILLPHPFSELSEFFSLFQDEIGHRLKYLSVTL